MSQVYSVYICFDAVWLFHTLVGFVEFVVVRFVLVSFKFAMVGFVMM